MRRMKAFLVSVMIVLPAAAVAGTAPPSMVPTLGEVGLVALGVGLIGAGVAALRRRRK